MNEKASPTEENYLKALFSLADDQGEVNISDLSQALSVSNPTANSMVKRLSEKGWLKYQKYKPLKVSKKGMKMAAFIIRKHRLTEMYLVEKMGFGWEEVHDIAEQIDHVQSPAFFDRMDEILGSPATDPHGSPIPDRNGNMVEHDHVPLDNLRKGQKAVIKGLNDSSKAFLEFLNDKTIELGMIVEVLSVEKFDRSMNIRVSNRREILLSKDATRRLMVSPL
jgi:DtxR family Mn-dependent transcriptional regulator